jgi:large repetitive protein
LTVTDANNCILILNPIEIIEPPLLTIDLISQVNVDCFSENTGSIDVDINGGRPAYDIDWIGPNGFFSNQEDISDLFAGEYTLIVTDTSGCTESLIIDILENDEIIADIITTDVTCYGANNGIIDIQLITGGVPQYDITWSNLGSGYLQENLSPGVYTITITDSLNCVKIYDVEIFEAPIYILEPDVQQISCYGEDDASITLNIVGGVPPFTIDWLDDPSAGIQRNNLPPGTYSVTVTDNSPTGPCIIEQDFVILYVAPLEISATVIDAFDCDTPNSGSINLSITGGTISASSDYNVTWSNGATTEDLSDIGPGVYFVTVLDDNNCEITGQWEVNRFEPLDLNVLVETVANCETQELYQVFTASTSGGIPDYDYQWSSGTVSGANGDIMTANQNGTVILTVTDAIGCIDNYSFNVDLPEIGDITFDATSDAFISFGFYSILNPIQFINLSEGDFEEIVWDFGDGNFSNEENPFHTYYTPGIYYVVQTVTYPFGCTYTYTLPILIEEGYKLVFPNAFTPNQDTMNDYFKPKFAGLNNLELRVYDTWGSLIYFESGNDISGWDGIIKNKVAENGNYYYTFKAQTYFGKIIIKDGPFTLIR